MSSIYDALKRSQAEKQLSFPVSSYGGSTSKKWYWVVLVAVLFSSLCTIGILYSLGLLGNNNQKNQVDKSPAHAAQEAVQTRIQEPVMQAPQVKTGPEAAVQGQAQDASDETDRIGDLVRKADKLHQKGNLEGAIQAYTELMAIVPSSIEMKVKLGGLYYEDKQYDRALETYKKALAGAPHNAKLLNNIGSVLLARNEAAPALKYFIQAHRNSSDYVEPLYNMACAYARLKKNGAALSSLRQACIMQPEARLWAKRDPDLITLRGDKEFEDIVRAQ